MFVITENLYLEDVLLFSLDEKTYALEEFTLEKPRSIFYVDKEIMLDNGVLVNATTLNLPYANTKVKDNNSILQFRSGFSVNLGNLINRVNGNYKQEKLAKKLKSEDTELQKIRRHFTNDFFISDLKIRKEYISQFLNYCISKSIITTFKNKNKLKLTELLIEESRLFPYQVVDEGIFLSKK